MSFVNGAKNTSFNRKLLKNDLKRIIKKRYGRLTSSGNKVRYFTGLDLEMCFPDVNEKLLHNAGFEKSKNLPLDLLKADLFREVRMEVNPLCYRQLAPLEYVCLMCPESRIFEKTRYYVFTEPVGVSFYKSLLAVSVIATITLLAIPAAAVTWKLFAWRFCFLLFLIVLCVLALRCLVHALCLPFGLCVSILPSLTDPEFVGMERVVPLVSVKHTKPYNKFLIGLFSLSTVFACLQLISNQRKVLRLISRLVTKSYYQGAQAVIGLSTKRELEFENE